MKKLALSLTLALTTIVTYAPSLGPQVFIVESEPINPYEKSWDAVTTVESGKNPLAVNNHDPNGGSHGIAQIGKYMLKWYNETHGTHYTIKDVYDVQISKRIFMAHMMRFPGMDIELPIKRWNGSGPKAEEYWLMKVRPLLERTMNLI